MLGPKQGLEAKKGGGQGLQGLGRICSAVAQARILTNQRALEISFGRLLA